MSRLRLTLIILVCLGGYTAAITDRGMLRRGVARSGVAAQSGCTPPLYQGFPSGCSAINLRWLNQDPIALIDHYDIIRGGIVIGTAPGNAISYTDPVGCGFGATYTIRQVMKSGATCSVTTTGPNAPHTKPCDLCTGPGPALNMVSSASFVSPVAPGSIATLFAGSGQTLTSATSGASSTPLPINLAGTRVTVNGLDAGLFYVSPTQINFLMPNTGFGSVNVVVTGPGGERTEGNAVTGPNPSIFSANSSGNGVAAAVVTSDGINYRRIFDANRIAVPISPDNNGQPNYLVLFGTGIRGYSTLEVKIGGQPSEITFAGPHPNLPGLDQINVKIPTQLRGLGPVLITVVSNGFVANFTQIHIGN